MKSNRSSSASFECVVPLSGARVLAFLAGVVAAATPAGASAQAIEDEFSVQRFDPAPGPRNYLSTRGARIDGHLAWSAGLMANYAYKPFVVVSCRTREDCAAPSDVPGRRQDIAVVENMATADLLGSLSLIDRVQLGLKIPVSFVEGAGIADDGTADPIGFSPALGDIALEVKARAYGELNEPFVVGGALFATAPMGNLTAEGKFVGDSTVTGGLRGIFDGRQGPFSFGGNLAGVLRGTGRVGSTEIGPEFRYGIGAGFEASPVVRILVDGFGATKFSSKNGTNTLEVDGGLQVSPLASPIVITAGAGTGVIEGAGVPTFRAIVGVMYVAEGKDRDGDGLYDDQDQCPTEAEDKDGIEDDDGCPDRDNDGDTISDDQDKCPGEPEDPDGFEDTDGCPELDNDKDGVPDENDRCREKPETVNGYKDDDGCPDEPDTDGDGVVDAKDTCKDQPEDTDGFQDTDGCPDPDNDGDGINDENDECVDEPETKNGFEDENGCPDEAPKP